MNGTIQPVVRRCAQALLLLTSLSALILCPHSKVEESFQLQATHDVYYYGLLRSSIEENYDHLQYPGVVPRTFVGPVILATLCRVVTILLYPIYNLADHPLAVQMVARGILLSLVCHAWFRMAVAASSNTSNWRGTYLLLITAVQFHMPFYASRMLPNTFALVLVLHAYSDWLLANNSSSDGTTTGSTTRSSSMMIQRSAVWLVTATAVFRCDILLLLFSVGLVWLIQRQLTIPQALRVGILTGIACLAVTVPLDSHMWQKFPIWPEGQVFYYNTVLGKSSNWGTSPWYWYLASALPKAMLLTSLLIPLAVVRLPENIVSWIDKLQKRPPRSNTKEVSAVDTNMLPYLLATAGFIGLYSCLGHKEMRFIFPAMPILNLAAAMGLERLHRVAFMSANVEEKDKIVSSEASLWLAKTLYAGALIGCCGVTLLASLAFIGVSRHNYPGGTALQILLAHLEAQQQQQQQIVLVHIDVAAAMTGVSLFGQRAAGQKCSFDKAGYEEEHSTADADGFMHFSHILSENKSIEGFHVVASAPGHPRLDWRRGCIATEDVIYVLERNHFTEYDNKAE